jgi:plastocyanin
VRRLVVVAGMTVLALVVPAWGATTDIQVRNTAYTPAEVTVAPGDTVRWTFAGPDTNHSVTADGGQAESFDSDPGDPSPFHAPGDTFEHTFATTGTFRYHCKVHAYMSGRVVVQDGGSPPAGDATAPAVSALDARGGRSCRNRGRRCRKRPTRISFTLSEAAEVQIELERSRGASPAPIVRDGEAGDNSVKLRRRRVRRGRYTLALVATDAEGNSSAEATERFRVR